MHTHGEQCVFEYGLLYHRILHLHPPMFGEKLQSITWTTELLNNAESKITRIILNRTLVNNSITEPCWTKTQIDRNQVRRDSELINAGWKDKCLWSGFSPLIGWVDNRWSWKTSWRSWIVGGAGQNQKIRTNLQSRSALGRRRRRPFEQSRNPNHHQLFLGFPALQK